MSELSLALGIWLGTYLLHSTVLFGVAWGIDRLGAERWRLSPGLRLQIWRAALIGALLTTTAQSAGLAERAPMASFFAVPIAAPATVAPQVPLALAAPVPSVPSVTMPPSTPPTPASSTHGFEESRPERIEPVRPASALVRAPQILALLWLGGALLLSLRLIVLGLRARRELAARAPAGAPLRDELAALCSSRRMSVPALTVAPAIAGPVALPNGEIVLPRWALSELEPRQLRAVLAHELAHQARRDPQWLAVALALDSLLWVQPLHHLARRRMAALAELEADAWAARAVRDPRSLAESLATCAEHLFTHRSHQVTAWSAGMVTGSTHDGRLLERIDHLLKGTFMSHPSSSWPVRTGAAAVLAAGVFLLPGCGPAGFASLGGGSSTSVSISDGGDVRISMHRPDYSLLMTCDAEATFLPDESDLATLAPGGVFEMTEKLAGVKRSYRVEAGDDGRLERTFKRNGATAPLDDDARRWFAEAAPRMFRESGWDAEARFDRLIARGGPDLVFTEVDLATGDFARSTYLGKLLSTVRLDQPQFERALASAAKFESDFELRRVLEQALSTQEIDSSRVIQLLTLTQQMDSDFELRSVLEQVASRGSDPVVASAYLDAARRLGSDFERREALIALLDAAKLDATGIATALELAAGFGSDFEKGNVLERLAASVASDPTLHRRYREVARGLAEFERGQALRALDDATAL